MSHTASNPAAVDNSTTSNPKVGRRGYSEKEAAYYLGLSRASLRQGRMEGKRGNHLPPPPYVRAGRKILYLLDDLDRWLEENRHDMSAAYSINRFVELAKEQRALMMSVSRPNTPGRITQEMISQARAIPVTSLIDFQRGKATAWCHPDKNPSLYYASRINRAACPVCARYFDAIDITMAIDGLNFTEAVIQ